MQRRSMRNLPRWQPHRALHGGYVGTAWAQGQALAAHQRERRRVHRMRAADLDDAVEVHALGHQRGLQPVQRRQQRVVRLERHRDMHGLQGG